MAELISIQQLKDASEDAITLADFIYKPANVMIPRRLAADINSLQYYLDYMSSYAQHSYETYDEMVANAPNLPNGVSAFVTNDLDTSMNGIYTYNGTSFVKGEYQPENAAKDFVEAKLGGLEVFDGKVRAQDVSTSDGSTQADKNVEFRNDLDALPFEGGVLADTFVTATKKTPAAVARTQRDVNADTIHVRDFGNTTGTTALLSSKFASLAKAKEVYPFVTDLSASTDWAIMQAFANDVGANNRGVASISGDLYINRPIVWNGSATMNIAWNAKFILDGGSSGDWALTFNSHAATHAGRLDLVCYETDDYDAENWSIRSWHNGIMLQRVIGADFSGLAVEGRLKGRLFHVDGRNYNGNYAKIGSLSGYCGSDLGQFTRTITSKVNSGAHSTAAQRTEITISSAVDFDIKESLIKIGTKYHLVVSNTGNKLTVYPWVTDTATTMSIMYGGILKTTGDNSNVITVKQVRGFRSANIYAYDTAYGVTIDSFGGEFCANALQRGLTPESSVGVLDVKMWYTEVNDTDIIDVMPDNSFAPITISNYTGLISGSFVTKVIKLAPIDDAANPVSGVLANVSLQSGVIDNKSELGIKSTTGYSASSTNYNYFGYKKQIRQVSDTATITLSVDERTVKLGLYETEIIHTGTRLNGGVSSTTLACEAPYAFENADEVSGRVLYFGASSKPRKLLVRLHGTVFRVYNQTEPSRKPYSDLSVDFGTGVVLTTDATTNTGTGFPTGGVVVESRKNNQDFYTTSSIDTAYAIIVGNLPVMKIRSRYATATSNWFRVIDSSMFLTTYALAPEATLPEVVAKINEILAVLRA